MAPPRAERLRWGHLSGDTVGQWSDLTNLLARFDGTDEFYEAEDLAEELEEAGMTPALDTWAVWDADVMLAFGQLRVGDTVQRDGTIRLQLEGGVHPDARARGIGRELMERMEGRARSLNEERNPGLSGTFRVNGGRDGSSARRMLRARGYEEVRYFTLMQRPLPGDHLPGDWAALSTPTPADEEAVRVAHNAAFLDHWGSAPKSRETWHDFYTGRPARPQYSTIRRRADGGVDTYVLVSQYVDGELFVDLVGTVREARGSGQASSALARTVELCRAAENIHLLGLEVDSANPTGATRIYERLGFVAKHTTAAMTRHA